jgi:hypothetical protein
MTIADGMREIWSIEQKAIGFFNKAFPADIAVFIFDNSGRHACKAKDAVQDGSSAGRKTTCDALHEMELNRVWYS